MSESQPDRDERYHGRRRGRPLRKLRTALLETLLPRLAVDRPAPGSRLDPASLFPHPVAEVWLEIGFGGGEHLAAQAAAHPAIGFVGCEPFLNGIAGLLTHIDSRNLANVRIYPDDARPLLDALPDASIGRCFVLFGDPWPKQRHRERRFVGPANLDRLARILKPGAELRLASDDPVLIAWMIDHAWHHPAFEWLAEGPQDWRTRPADWPPTRYEQKAITAGRRPVFLRFRRRF
ncbi:MAG: tRNA (guanosine(46)-N7)-methyltransferase TrmB [Azospirillum sp.]|nr:tRNA (guanosine(46)-N7)-methyltransferase TrmB [Azospirillum sp.]